MRSRWVLNLRLPIIQATTNDLDPVASFVAMLIIFDELIARLSSWDDTVALRKIWPGPHHLIFAQPTKIAHDHPLI